MNDQHPYIRPEVMRFAYAMEAKLRKNDHKAGWKNDHPVDLLNRLDEERKELVIASSAIHNGIEHLTDGDVLGEAADVGNFAMMVADVMGTLKRLSEEESTL